MIRTATRSDIPSIQQMAEATWWPTYGPIVDAVQIRYMLDMIYSEEALTRVMQDGSQQFIIISDTRGDQGFAAYGTYSGHAGAFKLHKIYVLPDNQGKGYGKTLLDEVCTRVRATQGTTLFLNVNRHNSAKTFYEKMGFETVREEDVPIGPYWMNDYVLKKELV
jgi:N-acetylglutamate synthase-like GNAT family acetyltransferase